MQLIDQKSEMGVGDVGENEVDVQVEVNMTVESMKLKK